MFPEIKGLEWECGAIGNAIYKGVLVKDLLLSLGVNLEDVKDKHLVAVGADEDF